MILSRQSIIRNALLDPTHERTEIERDGGRYSYGLSAAGYDLRLDTVTGITPNSHMDHGKFWRIRPGQFVLASAMERFDMPVSIIGIVHDKSSWARRGLAVQNTVIEPGWRGYLTLELTNHGSETLTLYEGVGICQVVFHWLDEATDRPYDGKYQDQERGPQAAR
ncbi:dCTP deaminase-dUTPase [Rhodobacter phage RcZahn]|nr:dCTP deaminase-dUTPase [Rhodobacter phage RcZahn]